MGRSNYGRGIFPTVGEELNSCEMEPVLDFTCGMEIVVDNKNKYTCLVCGRKGLKIIIGENKGVCDVCGFWWSKDFRSNKIRMTKWGDAWQKCGAEPFYEKSLQEKNMYMRQIKEQMAQTFLRPTENEIKEHRIPEECFAQHGFHRFSDKKKVIVVWNDNRKYYFDFDTSTIIDIPDTDSYFAVGLDCGRHFLFVSDNAENIKASEPYRTNYEGLLPGCFSASYPLDTECVVDFNHGGVYHFKICTQYEDVI